MDILGKNFSGEVEELLPLPTADKNRRPSRLSGVSLSEHVSRLHATRKLTSAVLGEMDIEECRLTSSPKIVPLDVRESCRAGGPERIFSDEAETTYGRPNRCETASRRCTSRQGYEGA